LTRLYGSSPYVLTETGRAQLTGFGVAYRTAGDGEPMQGDAPERLVDIAALERATKRHMDLQDRLADELRRRGLEPRSPGPWQPQFDLAFESGGARYVVEVKTGAPATAQQVRLGVGQLLEYCHLLDGANSPEVRPVLLLEGSPPEPWRDLCGSLGIHLIRGDQLDHSINGLLGPT
jgi:hypothetical protein